MRRLITAAACMAAAAACPSWLRAQDSAAAGAGGGIIDSIEVSGNRRVNAETIRNNLGIGVPSSIGFRAIQRAVRALFALQQFDDVQIFHRTGAANESILHVIVSERPLVVRATVRGTDKLSERTVRERVEVVPGRPLDPAAIARARVRIDSLYEANGYYLAKIEPQIVPLDSGNVAVVIDIDEGRRVAIASVEIEGNVAFADEAIVKSMATRPEGFWWFQDGDYADAKIREDLDKNIPEFYGSRGFVDFRILRDTLLVDGNNGKAILRIDVDEGREYRVGTVTVEGNRFFDTEQVMSLNPFQGRTRSGLSCLLRNCNDTTSVFNQVAWDEATSTLRTRYANEGYIYADVQPTIERIPPADSNGIGVVNLAWVITERRPAIINRIDIVGNDVTHERVIREAIVILPGDVFAQDRIIRSYQNISNLGFFQQPMPFPDTRPPDENGDIDIVFRVQEKHTGNVNFGASVGQGAGVGGFLGLEEPNLFGQGKHGKLQWQFGKYINDFSLSYSDPSLFGSRISGTGEVHNSRIRYTIQNLGRINSRGTSLQFGFPLPRSRYSRLFVNAGLDWEKYSGESASLSVFQCANCFRTSVGLSLVRDTRVDLPFPTGGSMHQAGMTFHGPFGSGTATFQRFDLEGRWYTPLVRAGRSPSVGGIKFVIGLSAKAGFVAGDAGPFFRQLFTMGGTQYGVPLRGYDEFSITPQGYNPQANQSSVQRASFGNSYFVTTAEFGARLTPQIYTSLFYDAGNVWASASAFNPTRLFRGAGVGVSMITPLGPIGLDFAYGFDRTNTLGQPAPAWKLHFKIGNFF